MTLRAARPEESGRLSEIAFRAKAAWGYPQAWLEAWRSELTIGADYVASHRVLVAESAAGVVGVVAVERRNANAVLEHLWVDPAHQGEGIGRALVKQALLLATQLGCQQVSVIADPHAEAFYRRLGAQAAGSVAAPMPGMPERCLPILQFTLDT